MNRLNTHTPATIHLPRSSPFPTLNSNNRDSSGAGSVRKSRSSITGGKRSALHAFVTDLVERNKLPNSTIARALARRRHATIAAATIAAAVTPGSGILDSDWTDKDASVLSTLTSELKAEHKHKVLQSILSRVLRRTEQQMAQRHQEEGILGVSRSLTVRDVNGRIQTRSGDKSLLQCGVQPGSRWIKLREFILEKDLSSWRRDLVQLMGGEHTELLRVCGEDPGERTFATWFDIWNGVIWEIGDGFSAYLDNSIHKQIRRAQGKLSIDCLTPANGLSDKPQNLCNLIQRLWNRRKRKVEAFHRTAHLATCLFGLILRPPF